MKNPYEEMLNAPCPTSKNHPRMSMHDRSAQFSPFAALTGFGNEINESNRTTEKFTELSEDEKSELDNVISSLSNLPSTPELKVAYFIPDPKKEGGNYLVKTGKLKKIDYVQRRIVLENDFKIDIDKIRTISVVENNE